MGWRHLFLFWSVVFLLVGLCSPVYAQTPIEVCWKPPSLPPGKDTFVVIEDGAGRIWEVLDSKNFYLQIRQRLVLHYNPNLGPETFSRVPEKMRPKACTPAAPPKPASPPRAKPPAPAPIPAPPQPPPKEETPKRHAAPAEPKSEYTPPPEPSAKPDPESYEAAHERHLKKPGLLPLCSTIKPDLEHPKPVDCPDSVLAFGAEDPILPKAKDARALPSEEDGGVLPNRSRGLHDFAIDESEPQRAARPDPRFVGQTSSSPAPASRVKVPDPPPPAGNSFAEQKANLAQSDAEAKARREGERIGVAWGEALGNAEGAQETLNGLVGGNFPALLRRNPAFAEKLQQGLADKLNTIPALPIYEDEKLAKIAFEGFLKGYARGFDDAKIKFGIVNTMATTLLAVGPDAAMVLETAGAKALRAAWQRLKEMPIFLPTGVGGPGAFVRRPKVAAAVKPTPAAAVETEAAEAKAAAPAAPATPTSTTVTTKVTSAKQAAGAAGKPVAKPRGGDTPAAQRGREAHEEFKKKAEARGWRIKQTPKLIDPKTGKELRPDAFTKNGNPIELKPNTPSGRAAGKRQIKRYEEATEKKGRVIYYDP